jgi:diketogulonate reductase-like aldo/keto reductase
MYTIPTKSAASLTLPIIGLGTYQMGERPEDMERDGAAIRWAIEHGLTHIDTAETYADGKTESLVSRVLRDVDRSSMFVASKVLPQHLRYDDVITACKASLERLGLDYLDLYLVHRPNPAIALDETMRAFASLYESGLVRAIGLSNATVSTLEEATAVSKYPIVNNQIHYSLSAREHERNGTLDWCAAHNVLVTAYRPIGVGKTGRGEVAGELLNTMAEKYGATPEQIAIAWVLAQPNVVTLVKSSNPIHLEQNLGSLDVKLSVDDIERLRVEFPVGETIWGPAL